MNHPPISSRQWHGLTGAEDSKGLFLIWESGEEYRPSESLIAAHQVCAWVEEEEHAEEEEKARVAHANAKAWRNWYPLPRPPHSVARQPPQPVQGGAGGELSPSSDQLACHLTVTYMRYPTPEYKHFLGPEPSSQTC